MRLRRLFSVPVDATGGTVSVARITFVGAVIVGGEAFEELVETAEGEPGRRAGGGELQSDQPAGEEVDEVVQTVSVGDAVDGSVDAEAEEKEGSDVPGATGGCQKWEREKGLSG